MFFSFTNFGLAPSGVTTYSLWLARVPEAFFPALGVLRFFELLEFDPDVRFDLVVAEARLLAALLDA
jgi:hypothetical protein